MIKAKRKELSRILVMLKALNGFEEVDIPEDLEISSDVDKIIKHVFFLLLKESEKRLLAEARLTESIQFVCLNSKVSNN